MWLPYMIVFVHPPPHLKYLPTPKNTPPFQPQNSYECLYSFYRCTEIQHLMQKKFIHLFQNNE